MRYRPSFSLAALVSVVALGVAAVSVNLIAPAPVRAATGIADYDLAAYWSPVWMQDTDSSDYITRFELRRMSGTGDVRGYSPERLHAAITG